MGRVAPSKESAVAARGDTTRPEQTEAYFRIVKTAIAEFDAGRFAEARALFLQAHELWPSARTWRTLGMTAFELSLYPRAHVELQAALDDARRPLSDAQREQVRTLLEQTRAFVGRYRVRVAPAEAQLRLDGALLALPADRTVLLAVGPHDVSARAAGFSDLNVHFQVEGREDELLDLSLEAAPRQPSAHPAAAVPSDHVASSPGIRGATPAGERAGPRRRVRRAIVIGSASVVLGTGVSLFAAGLRARAVVRSPGRESLSYAAWLAKRDRYPLLLGVGGALLGTGLIGLAAGLWVLLPRSETGPVQVSLEGTSLALSGAF